MQNLTRPRRYKKLLSFLSDSSIIPTCAPRPPQTCLRRPFHLSLQGRGQPGPALHRRKKQAVDKMANAKGLSLRGCFAPVAISGRHFQVVQGNDKTYRPIASVAALTAQPLAALPPYGCGVPLAGCERPVQGYSTAQGRWCTSTLPDVSLRGGRRPTWQSPATGCVFAEAFLLFTIVLRDSHVASLLGMTNLFALRQ